MYKQLKNQIDEKRIIDKNIRELEDRIKFKIQRQLGLHGTTFEDIKIFFVGKQDDKFLRVFSQVEKLDKDLQELKEEQKIIKDFVNDVYNSITNMNNIELNVFKCKYILGLSNQQIAERLNYSIQRIKQINKKIINKLKD